MVDVRWTSEQDELRSLLSRAFNRAPDRSPATQWQTAIDLGLVGLSLPEPVGSGATIFEEMLLAEQLGRSLASGPLLQTTTFGLPLLALVGKSDIAADVVCGKASVTVAWADEGSEYHLAAAAGTAFDDLVRPEDDHVRLSAHRRLVPGLTEVTHVVVVSGGDRPRVHLVSMSAPGITLAPRVALDESQKLGDLTLCNAQVVDLCPGGLTRADLSMAFAVSALLTACQAVGVAEAVLDLAKQHVAVREQFGRPVGSFQAVGHPLADVYTRIELARSLSLGVAWDLSHGNPQVAMVAGLSELASATAERACETAIQAHGGLGMTWESDLHHYYKRAQFIRRVLGPRSAHTSRIQPEIVRQPSPS